MGGGGSRPSGVRRKLPLLSQHLAGNGMGKVPSHVDDDDNDVPASESELVRLDDGGVGSASSARVVSSPASSACRADYGAAAGTSDAGTHADASAAPRPIASLASPPRPPPPPGTATYGLVAYHTFGPLGLHILDAIMAILLLGIIIAYEAAVMSFLRPTPLSTRSGALDALWTTVFVIAPLSCVPDMGYLGKFSACGILAVVGTFVVIFWYGLSENRLTGFGASGRDDLWPGGEGREGGVVEDLSRWFGVAAFGYGIVPITYNVRESMREPGRMYQATKGALLLVYVVYVVIGNGVAIVYKPSLGPEGFTGDVTEALPTTGGKWMWIPTAVRLSMTFVVLVTAPLIAVPCAELFEGKLGVGVEGEDGVGDDEGGGGSVVGDNEETSESDGTVEDSGTGTGAGRSSTSAKNHGTKNVRSLLLKVVIRYGICLFCTGVAILVPGFVNVLSFVGAFCVALTSFVFPPLLHLTLLSRRKEHGAVDEDGDADPFADAAPISATGPGLDEEGVPLLKMDAAATDRGCTSDRFESPQNGAEKKGPTKTTVRIWERRWTLCTDVMLLAWGIIATAITSVLTFSDLVRASKIMHGGGS